MKFCGLKTYLFLSAQVVIVLFLIYILRSPKLDQMYPRREEESKRLITQDQHIETSYNFSVPRGEHGPMSPNVLGPDATTKGLSKTPARLRPLNLQEMDRRLINKKSTSLKTKSTVKYAKVTKPNIVTHTSIRTLRKYNFTAEPHWDFDENYNLDSASAQTTCPISVKIKALNSSWMSKLFLPQVTIFMDRRHFSDQEWNRLGYFIPPFGWMALNYTVVQEVVSALPQLPNQQILLSANQPGAPRCVSCAVVGNGGILNGSNLGQEIDTHDYVFRVNGAVIKGFEKDVGSRTSFYGFTAFTMLSSLNRLKNMGFAKIPNDKEIKYILFTEGERDYEWLKAVQQNKEIRKGTLEYFSIHPRDSFENFDPQKLLVAHPDFTRYLKNRFLRSNTLNGKHWKIYRPSTGALVLMTAIHLCDTVSAYGYLTNDFKKYSDHYYDMEKTKFVLYFNHDFMLEKDLWEVLHRENIIKLYQRA
ncbi:alpha-N-acetylgalactosaminide alpha-2,6-sialyltransferase 1 [Pelodytes ibericus]